MVSLIMVKELARLQFGSLMVEIVPLSDSAAEIPGLLSTTASGCCKPFGPE